MEAVIVLAIGAVAFWLLYGREGGSTTPPTPPATAKPRKVIGAGWWAKYGLTFFVILAATSWAGGIAFVIAAVACLILFWDDI